MAHPTLDDLVKVVGEDDLFEEMVEDNVELQIELMEEDETTAGQEVQAGSSLQTGPWPPKLGEHLAVNFEDGFYVGEVLEILDDETVKVSYMVPKKISTASVELNPRLFWYWPAQQDLMSTSRAAVLPLRPVLKLAAPPSTKRFVVFKLENLDFVEKFADM